MNRLHHSHLLSCQYGHSPLFPGGTCAIFLLLLSFFLGCNEKSTGPTDPDADGTTLMGGTFRAQDDGEEITVQFGSDGSFNLTVVDLSLNSCSTAIGTWQVSQQSQSFAGRTGAAEDLVQALALAFAGQLD